MVRDRSEPSVAGAVVTVADLIDLAQSILANRTSHSLEAVALAQGVMDRLGESRPCGLDEPEVKLGRVWQPMQWHQMGQLPDDSDAMARMLLHASDAARAADEGEG
jgi:hypothetical protein